MNGALSAKSVLAAVVSAAVVTAGGWCVGTPSASAATSVTPVLTGLRGSATRVPFSVSPEISASVDVGTGNLMVSTKDRAVPTMNGALQWVGLSYQSF